MNVEIDELRRETEEEIDGEKIQIKIKKEEGRKGVERCSHCFGSIEQETIEVKITERNRTVQ